MAKAGIGLQTFENFSPASCLQDVEPLPTILRDVSGSDTHTATRQKADKIVRNQNIHRQFPVDVKSPPSRGPTLGARFVLKDGQPWPHDCNSHAQKKVSQLKTLAPMALQYRQRYHKPRRRCLTIASLVSFQLVKHMENTRNTGSLEHAEDQ